MWILGDRGPAVAGDAEPAIRRHESGLRIRVVAGVLRSGGVDRDRVGINEVKADDRRRGRRSQPHPPHGGVGITAAEEGKIDLVHQHAAGITSGEFHRHSIGVERIRPGDCVAVLVVGQHVAAIERLGCPGVMQHDMHAAFIAVLILPAEGFGDQHFRPLKADDEGAGGDINVPAIGRIFVEEEDAHRGVGVAEVDHVDCPLGDRLADS